MTWIGGIFISVDSSQSELRKKLALMMETSCLANESSAAASPFRTHSIFDDAHGQAMAQISIPIERTPPEYAHADYQGRPVLIYDGHLYGSKNVESKLSRAQHRVSETTAECLVHLLAELPGSLEQKVRRALPNLEGDYALAVSNADQIVASRNSLGTKPLYFAHNGNFSAFASNKKALWKIGSAKVRPVRAGMLAVFSRGGVSTEKVLPPRKKAVAIKDIAQAVDVYEHALCSAVRERLAAVNRIRKVGVLLSGGVDSCLIAKLVYDAASIWGMEAIAYTAGLPDSQDVKSAREFAAELGIKHEVKTLSIDEVEQYIPKVIEAIEDSDFVQVETGIGLYAAIDVASQDGIRIVLSGQGPDELWGGYSWYPRVLGKDGRHELCRRMRDDLSRADIETLDRENKIATAHGVELLFPYLDTEVVDVAMSVASELKVASEEDRLGKHPHRQLAIKMGIPERYANREKLAIQHGTAIHGVLDSIARQNGFDPSLVKHIGYRNEEISKAKMGSSARYGYRYIDKRLWQVPQHVQFFLHALAYSKGLLDKSVRDGLGHFVKKATLCARVSV